MQISSIQRPVQAADVPVEHLAENRAMNESEKVAELSRQFEAMLVRQILTEAHKSVLAPKEESQGVSKAIYQDLITQIQAESISHSGALGVARALERQLQHEVGPKSGATEEVGKSQ
jgi:Rod binding domain-containing protein